jgi:hypothetical protein
MGEERITSSTLGKYSFDLGMTQIGRFVEGRAALDSPRGD